MTPSNANFSGEGPIAMSFAKKRFGARTIRTPGISRRSPIGSVRKSTSYPFCARAATSNPRRIGEPRHWKNGCEAMKRTRAGRLMR